MSIDDLRAENEQLRQVLQSYFDHDWSEKIGLWEEQAKAALSTRAKAST